MAKGSVEEIRDAAFQYLAEQAEGLRYSDLVRKIIAAKPHANEVTVYNVVKDLPTSYPGRVVRPERGLYRLVNGIRVAPPPRVPAAQESEFYSGFAQWLQGDLEEVTTEVPLGGAGLGRKWGTPDVVGVYRRTAAELIDLQPEIVSMEVKTDPQQPVVAFGQAIAYRLFSSKTYIAMPNSMAEDDKSRLESLCVLFGVGLVLFELNPEKPEYAIRVRAQKFAPDMFYVNEFAEGLKRHDESVFRKLFG